MTVREIENIVSNYNNSVFHADLKRIDSADAHEIADIARKLGLADDYEFDDTGYHLDVEYVLKEDFTEKGKQMIKDAKDAGLYDFYDPFAGNFSFTSQDLESNKDKIKEFIKTHSDYAVIREPASAYEGNDYLEKSKDDYAYFLTNWGLEDAEIVKLEESINEDNSDLKKERDELWAKMPDCTKDELQRLIDIRKELGDDEFYSESLKESKEEDKLETFEDKMNFLAKDEQEAIDGYDKVLALLDAEKDAIVIEQLNKIKVEEEAHKKYLEDVKENHDLVYTEPLDLEESRGKGFVCEYKGYHIIDAGDRFVITDKSGLNVGETKFGLPIAKGMIDEYTKVNEGAEGHRVPGKEYVIYEINDAEKKAPIVAIRKTYTEAQYFCNKDENFTRELGIEEVPEGRFKKGDDFWGPFDGEWNLVEASSAEKKAYKDGGQRFADYIQGKAIARIKDPEARDAAVALAKAGNSKVDRFVGDRKVDQAERSFEKKADKMQKAGVEEAKEGKHVEYIEMPHEVYETPEDIRRINDELDAKAKAGKLIGIRKEPKMLQLAEPEINGIWTIYLNDKGFIEKIVVF